MNVLIVEDDKAIATNLYDYLGSRGYEVDVAYDGVTGLHLAVVQHWDAILLDVSLPGIDGLTLCRKLREDARRDTPILMLTAKDALDDKLRGFAQGADDYLVKPFSLKEVDARLSAMIRRYKGQVAETTLCCADVRFDLTTLRVARANRPLSLPPKCLYLLRILMQSPNRVVGRRELEAELWGEELPDSDTLRTHVYILRRALTAGGEDDLIETVHGIGYRLVVGGANAP
ncbi:MAG: response regulator transcription factor [Casimicrobiaceae bacterium]